jgi:hypothetical protein
MRFGLIVQVTGPLGDPRPLVRAFIQSQRPATEPFDVMAGGDVPFDDPAKARAILAEYAEAGVTWWVEGVGAWRGDVDAMAAFIQGGAPGR